MATKMINRTPHDRLCRRTGTRVKVEVLGPNRNPGPYKVTCEHGTELETPNLSRAVRAARTPDTWCEKCLAAREVLETAPSTVALTPVHLVQDGRVARLVTPAGAVVEEKVPSLKALEHLLRERHLEVVPAAVA